MKKALVVLLSVLCIGAAGWWPPEVTKGKILCTIAHAPKTGAMCLSAKQRENGYHIRLTVVGAAVQGKRVALGVTWRDGSKDRTVARFDQDPDAATAEVKVRIPREKANFVAGFCADFDVK